MIVVKKVTVVSPAIISVKAKIPKPKSLVIEMSLL
jgi:hypothetical protein